LRNLRFTGHRIEASDLLIHTVGFAPHPVVSTHVMPTPVNTVKCKLYLCFMLAPGDTGTYYYMNVTRIPFHCGKHT